MNPDVFIVIGAFIVAFILPTILFERARTRAADLACMMLLIVLSYVLFYFTLTAS